MYASDYRRIAREKLAGNWGVAILVAFLASLMGGAISSTGFSIDIDTETLESLPPQLYKLVQYWLAFGSVLGLVQFIIGGPIQLGNCRYLLNQHDGTKHELQDLFSAFGRWGEGFLLKLLTGLYVFLWTLLFIIPGIIAGYRYAMAPFIMAENPGMSASEAINASKEMMDGHKWELFCLHMSFLGWALLCAFTAGIGSIFLNPYTSAANAAFYRNLSPKKVETETEPQYIPPVEF